MNGGYNPDSRLYGNGKLYGQLRSIRQKVPLFIDCEELFPINFMDPSVFIKKDFIFFYADGFNVSPFQDPSLARRDKDISSSVHHIG